jgi:hypothetical protein
MEHILPPPTPIFKGAHEGHEGFGNRYIKLLNFVLFAIFVVKPLVGCGSIGVQPTFLSLFPVGLEESSPA